MSNHPDCPCNECMITRDRDRLWAEVERLRLAIYRCLGKGTGCLSPPPNCPDDWPGYGSFHCGWCAAKAALATLEEKP